VSRIKNAWSALCGKTPQPAIRYVEKEVEVPVEKIVEKTVEVEKIVRVLGEPEAVTLYRAVSPAQDTNMEMMRQQCQLISAAAALSTFGAFCPVEPPELLSLHAWHGRLFTTCEQAFAECPGAKVEPVTRYRIGRDYYAKADVPLSVAVVQPKPKRAKGGRA